MRKQRGASWIITAALVLVNFAAPLYGQYDQEPNNTPAQALPISLPYGQALGFITSLTDIDFYRFQAAAGLEVVIRLDAQAMGSNLIPMLSIYDPNGSLLAYNDIERPLSTGLPGPDPILYFKVPSSGTYFIAVTSAVNFLQKPAPGIGLVGEYFLLITSRLVSDEPFDRYEPNDSPQNAKAITIPFKSDGAHLLFVGDIDWYRITARKGEQINIDVDALELNSTAGWQWGVRTRIGLFDDRNRLIQSADAGVDPDTGFEGEPSLTFTAPQDGTFFIAVTLAQDLLFKTVFNNQAFLADPRVGSGNATLGHYQLRVRILREMYFPQIANGSFGSVSFVTSILLVNPSSMPANGSVRLLKADGGALVTTFSPSGAKGSTDYFTIPPKSSRTVKTDGLGPGTSAYAVVTATEELGGIAVFSEYDSSGRLITEAGVGESQPLEFMVIPVEVGPDLNTGIALANATARRRASLYFRLVNTTGQVVASRTLPLEAGNQMSMFVSGAGQLFPSVISFRGSLQVMSDAPISAVALRSSSKTMTTLPPTRLNQSFTPMNLTFPLLVAGSSGDHYKSTIVLTNPGYFTVQGTVRFNDGEGSPLPLSLASVQGSTFSYTIPPLGTVYLEASATGGLARGYAVVLSDHGIGGVLILSRTDSVTGRLNAEAGIPSTSTHRKFLVPVLTAEGYDTGIALSNLNAAPAELRFVLLPESETSSIQESVPAPLEAGRQRMSLISGEHQLFPSFTGHGTLEVNSSAPLVSLLLRLSASSMTALPVVPIP